MSVKLDVKELRNNHQYEDQMVVVSDNEEIKVITFTPNAVSLDQNDKMPIVFIGGWLALTDSYFEIINRLREEGHVVIYIETREKNSSTATELSDLSRERLFRDVQEVLYNLAINEPFIMLGHSLGAVCSLLQAIDEDNPKYIPSRIIALQPVIKPVIQKTQLAIFKLPTCFFKIARNFMVKIAPFFSTKLKKSDYSRRRFQREFLEADPGKLRRSAIGFEDFCLNDYLSEIDIPVLFLGISEDEQHPIEDPIYLAHSLPKTAFYDLLTEEIAFSSTTAEIALRFLRAYEIHDSS